MVGGYLRFRLPTTAFCARFGVMVLSGRKAVKFVEAIGFAKGVLGPDVDSFLDLRESKEPYEENGPSHCAVDQQ